MPLHLETPERYRHDLFIESAHLFAVVDDQAEGEPALRHEVPHAAQPPHVEALSIPDLDGEQPERPLQDQIDLRTCGGSIVEGLVGCTLVVKAKGSD